MRRLITFPCEGETLVGTLDEAPGQTGLLIVSGGNEIRIGAHRGMALLAADLAAEGVPVLRYDRRGIGDSTGTNAGFDRSGPDLAAAAAAFRVHQPHLERIVAFGNCDAATALALYAPADVDALVLANPWAVEKQDDLPPPAAIRARYLERIRDPASWWRLLSGGVNPGKLARGLLRSLHSSAPALEGRLAEALGRERRPVTILLAARDNTAIAFADAWRSAAFEPARRRAVVHRLDTASHSFARTEDKAWLRRRLLEAIGR